MLSIGLGLLRAQLLVDSFITTTTTTIIITTIVTGHPANKKNQYLKAGLPTSQNSKRVALTEARQIVTYQLLGQSHLGLDPARMSENEMLRVNDIIWLLGENREAYGFVCVEKRKDEGTEPSYLPGFASRAPAFFSPLESIVKKLRWGLFGESERVGVWTKQEGAFCHCKLLPACISLID